MTPPWLGRLLEDLEAGRTDAATALRRLRGAGEDPLPFAHFDPDRPRRTGMEEVIFAPGKEPEQIAILIERSLEHHDAVLITRVTQSLGESLAARFPDLQHHPRARLLCYRGRPPLHPGSGTVAVVTAGTADLPVADEAALTLEHLGSACERVTDVGVAGIHRLLSRVDQLRACSVVVVVAGMEGALPGVVAGLVDRPIVAVPTSVGVGAHFGGVAPLLTMLNTCAPGVSVVNIDNGFAAACVAHRINRVAVQRGVQP